MVRTSLRKGRGGVSPSYIWIHETKTFIETCTYLKTQFALKYCLNVEFEFSQIFETSFLWILILEDLNRGMRMRSFVLACWQPYLGDQSKSHIRCIYTQINKENNNSKIIQRLYNDTSFSIKCHYLTVKMLSCGFSNYLKLIKLVRKELLTTSTSACQTWMCC